MVGDSRVVTDHLDQVSNSIMVRRGVVDDSFALHGLVRRAKRMYDGIPDELSGDKTYPRPCLKKAYAEGDGLMHSCPLAI